EKLGIKNPVVIDVALPNIVITKNIEIPSIDPQEIREIINLQAGRHTPYAREEIIIDYIDIGTYKRSYTKILLIIVVNSVLKRHLEILNRAGVRLEQVSFSAESAALAVSKILKTDTEKIPAGIVHIDASFTDFMIVFRNKPLFIRSIPIGAQQLLDEEERYRAKFVEEIKKSIEAYQNENIEKNPEALILTGSIEGLKGMEAALGEEMHLPVNRISYMKNIAITPGALKTASESKYASFFNLIAPLFLSEDIKINLMPEEVKTRRAFEERGKDLIKTGMFALSFFIFLFFILASKIYFAGALLKKLEAQYTPISREAESLEIDFNKVSLIKNYLSKKRYSLDVLNELYTVIPDGVELADIRFDGQGKFAVKGTAESMSTVFAFVDSMEKSQYFKDVKTKYTAKRKDGSRDVTDFEIASLLDNKGNK
ncbi:MAG: pilus assembly protein PilM, partial [Candidatus Omnitrophica bacterium]|nr:pilus assembly protein PilM [Candidatus Omnitrophota bacterium]